MQRQQPLSAELCDNACGAGAGVSGRGSVGSGHAADLSIRGRVKTRRAWIRFSFARFSFLVGSSRCDDVCASGAGLVHSAHTARLRLTACERETRNERNGH